MTTIAIARTVTDHAGPFSSQPPNLQLGRANQTWNFAFNYDDPRGVKLLADRVFARLSSLKGSTGVVPSLAALENRDDELLFENGLIKLKGRYVPRPTSASPGTPGPLNVWLHISDACNLGCFYCYIPNLKKHLGKREAISSGYAMTEESLALIADRLIAHCKEEGIKRLHIKFAGGEPTLAISQIDHLCRMLEEHADEIQISYGLLTNGVFDPLEVIPILTRHRFKVSVSIDGDRKSHDRIRYVRNDGRREGTWDGIWRNTERLRTAGFRPYFLHTITQKNIQDLEEIASLVTSLGCGFRLSLERGQTQITSEVQDRVRERLLSFYEWFGRTAPLNIRFHRDAMFAEWSLDKKKQMACTSCRNYVAIGREGQIASCQMRLDEPLGDLREDSFKEATGRFSTDTRTILLRHPEQKTGACTRCEYRYTCAGGCPQHTREVYKDFNHPSPWCGVYGELLPVYIHANATHLARRVEASALSQEIP